jgi:hypothetical protein
MGKRYKSAADSTDMTCLPCRCLPSGLQMQSKHDDLRDAVFAQKRCSHRGSPAGTNVGGYQQNRPFGQCGIG